MHKNFLDALRGVAALSVFAQHLMDFYIKEVRLPESPALEASVQNYLNFGRFGVVLFFLLSGYLIPQSLLASKTDKGSTLQRFAIRRAFRIYPAFWVCMLVACAANWVYYDRAISLREVVLNATMLPSLFHTKPILGLYWTLAVELMFYIMCAGLYSFNSKLISDARASGLICCALAGACALPILLNNNFGTHLPEQYLSLHFSALFLGNTLRIQIHKASNATIAITLPMFLIASAIASGALQDHTSKLNTLGGNGFFHGDVLAIILFVFALKVPARWPSSLTEAGLVSYSMYLLHWPVTTLTALIPTLGTNPALHVCSTVLITLLLSWLTFNGIERPFMDFSKFLVNKLPTNSMARLAT